MCDMNSYDNKSDVSYFIMKFMINLFVFEFSIVTICNFIFFSMIFVADWIKPISNMKFDHSLISMITFAI